MAWAGFHFKQKEIASWSNIQSLTTKNKQCGFTNLNVIPDFWDNLILIVLCLCGWYVLLKKSSEYDYLWFLSQWVYRVPSKRETWASRGWRVGSGVAMCPSVINPSKQHRTIQCMYFLRCSFALCLVCLEQQIQPTFVFYCYRKVSNNSCLYCIKSHVCNRCE